MENGPFEDVFPIRNGDIPASYVSLPEGIKFRVSLQRLLTLLKTRQVWVNHTTRDSWPLLHLTR